MRHLNFFSIAAIALACSMQASAQTVTTDVMDPATEGSFLKIINDAKPGEHVDIDFNFDGTELVYKGTKAIDLQGKDITINGLNAKNGKKVIFTSPVQKNEKNEEVGSSMFRVCKDTKLNLTNVQITGCQKIALFCENNGVLNISDCNFYNNKDIKLESGNNGGVLRHSGGTVVIERSVFDGNEGNGGYGGGAICAYNSKDKALSLTVRSCTFNNNTGINGGAIAVNVRDNNCVPTVRIENCTFSNNFISNRGGAIYMQDAHKPATNAEAFKPVFVNNTFVGNTTSITTSDDGGAINFWARATAVAMEPILFNNLFAANYYDPFKNNRLNDIKCFYLEGDKAGETVQPQTVNPKVANNIFGAVEDKFYVTFGSKNNNSAANFDKDEIFLGKELNPFEGGDPEGTHFTAKLYGDLKVAAIAKNSVAIGKGVAKFEGIEAPATDQFGNARPATPSVGAAEYTDMTATGVKAVGATANGKLAVVNGAIVATGFEGAAKLDVINVAGQWMLGATVRSGERVAIDNLPAGVYVARINGASVKFVK